MKTLLLFVALFSFSQVYALASRPDAIPTSHKIVEAIAVQPVTVFDSASSQFQLEPGQPVLLTEPNQDGFQKVGVLDASRTQIMKVGYVFNRGDCGAHWPYTDGTYGCVWTTYPSRQNEPPMVYRGGIRCWEKKVKGCVESPVSFDPAKGGWYLP